MADTRALFKKEFAYYLNSPIAWVVAILYILITTIGLFFFQNFMADNVASLKDYFVIVPYVFIVLIPALTMGSWAEERRTGTHELLLTMPYPVWRVVLAKFMAPLALILVILLISLSLPLSVAGMGSFDLGVIVTQYLGVILLAAASVALGTFISSLVRSQILAFLLSVAIIGFFTVVDTPTRTMVMPAWLSTILTASSLTYHFDSFSKGLLDSRDILFFAGLTVLFLYLNERRIVLAKWSKS